MELELLGKVYGRGAHNPVEHRPVLRDDRQVSRWHERPTALLTQILRMAKLLEAQQPPPTELLELALQYLAEEKPVEHPTPTWAEDLGLTGDDPPTTGPVLSQLQVAAIVDSLQQEIQPQQAQGQPTQQGQLLAVAKWQQCGRFEAPLPVHPKVRGLGGETFPVLLSGKQASAPSPTVVTALEKLGLQARSVL